MTAKQFGVPTDQRLRAVLEGTAATTGEEFFRSLVQHFAEALQVKYAFVAQRVDGARTRTLAYWCGNEHRANLEWDVAGTPCERVVEGHAVFYPDGVRALFPADTYLQTIGARSYLAVPIRTASGDVVGHLGALDTNPMQAEANEDWILRVFAERAGAEFTRLRVEEQLRESQERLLKAQKMEMIGTLAGGVAHDFNNLLTTVQGNASLALIGLPRDSPLRSAMHAIEDAALHGAALVQQMLTYAGEGKVSRESLAVSELIEKLGPLLATSVPDTTVIDYNLHRGLPPIVANATQVSQVVINLVTNASEAIGDADGAITVSTGMLTHGIGGSGSVLQPEDPSGGYVYIEVSETGLGMDEATQAKMWDPFFTTKFAGRGLGLAAVQGIVRSYGGATEVVSQPGGGTQVRTLFAVT